VAEATEAKNVKRWKAEIEEIKAAQPTEPPRAYIAFLHLLRRLSLCAHDPDPGARGTLDPWR